MFKNFLFNAAFSFVKEYLLSDSNMDVLRQELKSQVLEFVADTDNEWDNEAADALFRFLQID